MFIHVFLISLRCNPLFVRCIKPNNNKVMEGRSSFTLTLSVTVMVTVRVMTHYSYRRNLGNSSQNWWQHNSDTLE